MTSHSSDFNYFAGIYALLGLLNGVFNVAAALLMIIGSVIAGEAIHGKLCKRILVAPMAFFDTTPLGRITNRFSVLICTNLYQSVPICDSV